MKLENEEVKNLFNILPIPEYESFKYESIPSKVKSAITREFNKTSLHSESSSSLESKATETKPKSKKTAAATSSTKTTAKSKPKEPNKEKPIVQKIYLEVPFAKKDEVKLLGAKWDVPLKKWYILDDNKNMEEILNKYKKN
jgi:hypothetical protein